MGYQAAVDLGTTYTAAAIHRSGRVEVVWLGDRAAVIPSVVYVRPDGSVITGDAASRPPALEPFPARAPGTAQLAAPMPGGPSLRSDP